MSDLVEFLTARLDKRATKAQAAMRGGKGEWTQVDPERYPGLIEDERREIVVYDEGSPTEEQAAHIAENDPARVLRDVEAKRRLLAMYEDAVRRVKNPPSAEARQAARVEQFVLEEVFRALAFPDEQPPPAEKERP